LGGELVEYNKHAPKPEMNHIDYGLRVMSSKIFDKYAIDTKFDLSDLFAELSKVGELAGYDVNTPFR
jgi:N-acetyl-alpha-D-muramate 1-phosphate uridylyltransferase